MTPQRSKPVAGSESQQLRALVVMLQGVRANRGEDVATLRYVEDKLNQMALLAEAGIHANPGYDSFRRKGEDKVHIGDELTIRVGPSLGYIEQLKYERTQRPMGFYFHDFGPGDALLLAQMLDGQKVILIANVNGKPLWGES